MLKSKFLLVCLSVIAFVSQVREASAATLQGRSSSFAQVNGELGEREGRLPSTTRQSVNGLTLSQAACPLLPVGIRLRTFIPSPGVYFSDFPTPLPLFGGDGRGFDYSGGTNRSFQGVEVDPRRPSPIVSGPSVNFGVTNQYGSSNGASVVNKPYWWWVINAGATPTATARLGVTTANNNVQVTRLSPTQVKVTFFLKGPNPLVPVAPPIQADIAVFIRGGGGIRPQYRIEGNHDGFPAYELYINGNLVYLYDPESSGKSPYNLGGSLDELVSVPWNNIRCRP